MSYELRLGSPSLSLQEAPCILAFCNGKLSIAPRVLVDAMASLFVINLIPSWWYLCVIFWAHDLLLCPDSYFVNTGRLIYVSWTTKVFSNLLQFGNCKTPGLITRQCGPPLSPSKWMTLHSSFCDSGVLTRNTRITKRWLYAHLLAWTWDSGGSTLNCISCLHCQSNFCCFLIM